MIGVFGVDYKRATINDREKLSFNDKQVNEYSSLIKAQPELKGVVILFTCNRTEIYFSTTDEENKDFIFIKLVGILQSYLEIDHNISGIFYYKTGEKAINHLFRVVSGFESMIFGEAQIASQVKEAYLRAEKLHTVDSILKRLFTKALETGKKVRTETRINHGAFSVSYAGIEKCYSLYPDLTKKNILIIGAGKTGELTLNTLIKKNCTRITISNRTLEKALYFGHKFGISVLDLEEIEKGLKDCDVVFIATSSQSFLITKKMMESVLPLRNHNPLVIIDYSVPRNVDPEVAGLNGIQLYDIDYLRSVLDKHTQRRKKSMKQGLMIIEKSIYEFTEWLNARKLKPVINIINDHFMNIHKSELQGFKKIHNADQDLLLDKYGDHITEKYIRLLIRNMKQVTDYGKKEEYIKVLEKLFELK